MIKKIKNKNLEEILSNAAYLGSYAMPGELTLAIIGARKEIKNAFETYTEACKQIGEARCERDGNEKPVTEFQKDEQGKDLINHPRKLKFKNATEENAALNELKKLGEHEVEIKIKEVSISLIESLKNITPVQMEAITSMVEIKNLQAESNNLLMKSTNGTH